MPVRDIWSLEPKRMHCELGSYWRTRGGVFFPAHDTGIGLLATKERKQVGIQVKESRYFAKKGVIVGIKQSVASSSRDSELHHFLTQLPVVEEHEVSGFDSKLLIMPSSELEKRLAIKGAEKR
jgi:HJR/Mrr/RecB family endonuclease